MYAVRIASRILRTAGFLCVIYAESCVNATAETCFSGVFFSVFSLFFDLARLAFADPAVRILPLHRASTRIHGQAGARIWRARDRLWWRGGPPRCRGGPGRAGPAQPTRRPLHSLRCRYRAPECVPLACELISDDCQNCFFRDHGSRLHGFYTMRQTRRLSLLAMQKPVWFDRKSIVRSKLNVAFVVIILLAAVYTLPVCRHATKRQTG